KPPPVLPMEIWDRILGDLGTLALKTFQLICRDWARLGAERLYSTLYLNDFSKSWSGLIAISESCYASLVEKVVWNPVVLLDECVDGEACADRYQPLLKGLSHSEVLQIHQQYLQIYRNMADFFAPLSIEAISNALCKLTNCNELEISEDYDLDKWWSDSHFISRLQNDSCILHQPSIWCRPQQYWLFGSAFHYSISNSLRDLIDASVECSTITHLIVDLEDGNVDHVVGYYRHAALRHIEHLTLRLSHFPIFDDEDTRHDLAMALGNLFRWTWKFPGLSELSIEVIFKSPRVDMARDLAYLEYDSDGSDDVDDVDDLDSSDRSHGSLEATQLALTSSTDRGHFHALTRNPYNTLNAEFILEPQILRGLRTLRLGNIILDMRHLIGMLCMQPQLPDSQISIHLIGTTILYGLTPPLFLALL
ncbi:uncharacterized protein A1O9_04968, partial [Exophiala aquamarina CBS 119918]